MIKKKMGVAVFLLAGLSLSAARLEVNPRVYRFGPVKAGEVVQAVFTLSNTGEEPVKIDRISTSCGCTTVSRRPESLAPGETFDLKVRFRTAGYRGKVSKALYLILDGSARREELRIEGEIEPKPSGMLEIEERSINLGTLSGDEGIVKEIPIRNSGDVRLEIQQITHPAFLQVILEKIILNPGEKGTLKIRVLPTIHGRGRQTIFLLTDTYYSRRQWLHVSYNTPKPSGS